MIITEIAPRTLSAVDVDADRTAARAWVAERYTPDSSEHVRLNMITSLTGSAVGDDGTSESLTGGADRLILGAIRAAADVVVVGAQTVRAEGYLLPRAAALAVVTRTGRLDGIRAAEDTGSREHPLYVLCPESRAPQVKGRLAHLDPEIVPLRGESLDPREIVTALRSRGLRRMVCEGGPSLAGQFSEQGLVDEYCVTVAPLLTAAHQPFLPLAASTEVAVAGHLVDDTGFSYLRLRARRPGRAPSASA